MWTMLPCCHANMIGLLIHQSQSSEPCCFLSKDFTIILSSPSCSLDHLFNDISHSWLMLLLPHFANQFWLVEGTPYSCFVFDKTIFVTTISSMLYMSVSCIWFSSGHFLLIMIWFTFCQQKDYFRCKHIHDTVVAALYLSHFFISSANHKNIEKQAPNTLFYVYNMLMRWTITILI